MIVFGGLEFMECIQEIFVLNLLSVLNVINPNDILGIFTDVMHIQNISGNISNSSSKDNGYRSLVFSVAEMLYFFLFHSTFA